MNELPAQKCMHPITQSKKIKTPGLVLDLDGLGTIMIVEARGTSSRRRAMMTEQVFYEKHRHAGPTFNHPFPDSKSEREYNEFLDRLEKQFMDELMGPSNHDYDRQADEFEATILHERGLI